MSESEGKGWTRRRFLEAVGQAGGTAAVYETMVALGLLNVPAAWAGPPQVPAGSGNGQSVVVLGAGIGGLTAAAMLRKAGFGCVILEAQERPGGRNFTARQGSKVFENIPGHGLNEQQCKFDPKLYLNLGPGRIPYHHRRVLHYCRELDVALEVYVMETTANLFFRPIKFDNAPMVNRRIANDTRGHVAELLAKAVSQGALQKELTGIDRNQLIELLKKFGDLGVSTFEAQCPSPIDYCGSTRSGCKHPITLERPCTPPPKLELATLLSSEFWKFNFYQPVDYLWQPTLFQPVGGMDKLVDGFTQKLGLPVRRQSEVVRIDIQDGGVQVYYRDPTGAIQNERADYCVSNIPLTVLKKIPVNFSPKFGDAVKNSKFAPSCKVGWQANERFWESDQNQIYGGISWTDQQITQIWYPSYDYHSAQGTLTGAYNYRENAEAFGGMLPQKRLETALSQAVKLHSEFGDPRIVPLDRGISIAWQNVLHQDGAWADWDIYNAKYYPDLLVPDRRFYVVGDQVSQLPGWQEGAMMSAEHVVSQIAKVLPRTLEQLEKTTTPVLAPNSRAVTEGT